MQRYDPKLNVSKRARRTATIPGVNPVSAVPHPAPFVFLCSPEIGPINVCSEPVPERRVDPLRDVSTDVENDCQNSRIWGEVILYTTVESETMASSSGVSAALQFFGLQVVDFQTLGRPKLKNVRPLKCLSYALHVYCFRSSHVYLSLPCTSVSQ